MMDDRRMDAYYYGFDTTGCEEIDKILGAVACAGKAFHHTEDWSDECAPYDGHTGETPIDWIQNAAKEAATEIERLRDALEAIRQYGSDTLSGRADGGADDRQWQREAVLEMTARARIALANK